MTSIFLLLPPSRMRASPGLLTGDLELTWGPPDSSLTTRVLEHQGMPGPSSDWEVWEQTPTRNWDSQRLVNVNNCELISQSKHSHFNPRPETSIREDPGLLMLLSLKVITCKLHLGKYWSRKHCNNEAEGTVSGCFLIEKKKNLRVLGQELVKCGWGAQTGSIYIKFKKKSM